MKDRVTLTLDKNLVKQIDASIDGKQVKNRSHAIEMLLYKALREDLPTTAVILAGGTDERIKEVVADVKGAPMIAHNTRLLANAGIKDAIIVTKEPEAIRAALDGEDDDIDIRYVQESTPLGTAGALHLAKTYIDEPFILTNGDEYKQVNIKDMYEYHKDHGGLCTIALTTTDNPENYGVALLNGHRIITFVEKPSKENAPTNLISAGFYICEPEVLDVVPDGYGRLEHEVFPRLANEDALYGYHFSGDYFDSNNT